MERLVEGFKRILAATGEDPGGLWPPHADKSTKLEMMTTIHAHWPKRNLPMHPLAASWWYPIRRIASLEWKTCSLEAGDGFSKLALCERGVQFGKEASKTRNYCVAEKPFGCFRSSEQAARLRGAHSDAWRDKERLAQNDNPTARTLAESSRAQILRLRQWDAKRWVDDVSTQLLYLKGSAS